MAYSLSFSLALGLGNTGLTLEGQLKDSAGVNVGSAITTGFVEYGASGNYQWYTTAIPDGHVGGVVFQVSPGGAVKAFAAISPQEAEYTDLKTSTRSSHTAADVWASGTRTLTSFGTLVADTTTAVWAAGSRTLTSFGTLVADTTTAVWAAVARTLTSFGTQAATTAAAVWDEARSGHLTVGTFGAAYAVLRDGTAQAGGAATITLDAGASAASSFYNNNILAIKSGTGAGQANIIASYVGSTKVATMAGAWVTPPDNTSVFLILPLGTIPGASAPTAAAVAAAVWVYSPRSLTQTAAEIAAVLAGTTITAQRGDTVTIALTALGNITSRTKLYFGVKDRLAQADTAAILLIEETAGLLYLNGAAGTAINATLVVNDATAGDITITLKPATSAALIARQNYRYDIQMVAGAVVTTLSAGTFTANEDVTRAIT